MIIIFIRNVDKGINLLMKKRWGVYIMCDDIFAMREDKTESYIIFTFANSCMPTLMKKKPSTMISFHKRYIYDISRFYSILSKEIKKFQADYYTLYESESIIYVLVYQKGMIHSVFQKYRKHDLFRSYHLMNQGFIDHMKCLKILAKRFILFKTEHNGFPHEVGLLLGYPLCDVEDYIMNQGDNYVLCGYWKVYHNIEEARSTFELYKKLRAAGMQRFYSGSELK